MRVVLQRVRHARVLVDDEPIGEIGRGYVLFVGVGHGDSDEAAVWLADKCAGLRVFDDGSGKGNLSIRDIEGEVLVVSQFTLYANTRKGRRPSYVKAAPPDIAAPLVEVFSDHLASQGIPVQKGIFGARMLVEIENEGPVTIILERDPEVRSK